jgi:hypothetical protein
LIIVPHVVARTVEVERAVVKIEMTDEARKLVSATTTVPAKKARIHPTEEGFYSDLSSVVGQAAADKVRRFLQELLEFRDEISVRLKIAAFVHWHVEVGDTTRRVSLIQFNRKGKASLGGLGRQWQRGTFIPRDLIESYWADVGKIHQPLRPQMKSGEPVASRVPLTGFVDKLDQIAQAVRSFMENVEAAVPDE